MSYNYKKKNIIYYFIIFFIIIGRKWTVDKNGQELFLIFLEENGLKENSISFLEVNGPARLYIMAIPNELFLFLLLLVFTNICIRQTVSYKIARKQPTWRPGYIPTIIIILI